MSRNLLHTSDVLGCIEQFLCEQQQNTNCKDLRTYYKIEAAREIALRIKMLSRGGLTVIKGGKDE
jgi:hypothetical protein